MYINPWTWFYDFQHQAIAAQKSHLLQLPRKYHAAWRYLEAAQYEDALRLFSEGVQLAEALNQPMWIYFFESWVCEVHVLSDQYDLALDKTTRLVAKSTQTRFQDHPVQAVVYFTLAWVYSYIDAVGYEQDILNALDTIESGEIPLDEETHQRAIYLRGKIAFVTDRFGEAANHNEDYMSRVAGNPFRESSGYGMRLALAYQAGDLPTALEAARLQESVARQTRLLNNLIHSVLWQGILEQYTDNTTKAAQTIERAITERTARNLTERVTYYHLLSCYRQARGDLRAALAERDHELAHAIESHSISFEFRSRLYRCYLLNAMGEDASDELAALEATARRSKDPTRLLERVAAAQAGKRTRYDWQETHLP